MLFSDKAATAKCLIVKPKFLAYSKSLESISVMPSTWKSFGGSDVPKAIDERIPILWAASIPSMSKLGSGSA